jgi:gamma-glutamyltranspeptidase/glutathione hydrolase
MTARNARGLGDVVVSPHELATTAGIEVFAAGGSAVDAAIAVNAVQGVVAPETCGVGGDLFALVWEPGMTEPATLDSSGWAGSGADPEELSNFDSIPWDHPLSVTIPGCVAGWAELSARFGRIPLAKVLSPAIRLAEAGFPVSEEMSNALERLESRLSGQPSGVDMYPRGVPPEIGDIVRRPLLATTLSDIATDGAASFYTGRPATAISEAVGNRITMPDLEGYEPEWIEPARLDVFGLTGWTMPPSSQGYLTLATLGVFERLGARDPDDPAWTHLLIEAYRSVAWERDLVVADRSRAPVPWQTLLAADRLDERAERILPSSVTTWPAPAPKPGGTAYMCAVGADGQAVSLIQSNFMGIGSGIGAGTAGFFLHNRGGGFVLHEHHPNRLAPRQRPLHTLSPSLWTSTGEFRAVLGTRGGHQQPQMLAQVAAAMFGAGLDPAAAQSCSRWTMNEFAAGSGSHLLVESDLSGEVLDHLVDVGHEIEMVATAQGGWGPVSTIVVDSANVRSAAADPRVETATAAVR